MDVTLPNGIVIKDIPEGTSRDAIKQKAILAGIANESDFPRIEQPEPSFSEKAIGTGDAILSAVTGAIAEPVAGLAGIAASANPFLPEGAGARAVEETREAFTRQPKTEQGQSQLETVGEFVQPFTEGMQALEKDLGDTAFDATGSKEIATIAASLPTAMLELLGVVGGKGAINTVKNRRILRDGAVPARRLLDEFDKRGVVFENLSPEEFRRIPSNLPAVARKGKGLERVVDDVMGAQIERGAGDANLAVFNAKRTNAAPGAGASGGGRFRLEPDRVAENVIKQGYEPGFVQSMKSASSDTKMKMREMNKNMRRIKSDGKLASEFRPSNTVGDAVTDRLMIIRNKANAARDELNDIATNKLKGKSVDARPVVESFKESLDKLGVKTRQVDGVRKFDFSESLIEVDPGSQKMIKRAYQLMNKNVRVDALQLHNLKKKLDALIDFNKTSKGGIPESGRKVLKGLRAEANKAIRVVDSDYARVNDVLHESLTSLDNFQELIGKRMPLFEEGTSKAIGGDMRILLSNYGRRVALEESLKSVDNLAKKYGYKGNDNIEQLAQMANRLDRQHGAVAETSFMGNIESAINSSMLKQAAAGDLQGAALTGVADKLGKFANKMRKVDGAHAFKAVDELLKR